MSCPCYICLSDNRKLFLTLDEEVTLQREILKKNGYENWYPWSKWLNPAGTKFGLVLTTRCLSEYLIGIKYEGKEVTYTFQYNMFEKRSKQREDNTSVVMFQVDDERLPKVLSPEDEYNTPVLTKRAIQYYSPSWETMRVVYNDGKVAVVKWTMDYDYIIHQPF
jgi:hypothetical protein